MILIPTSAKERQETDRPPRLSVLPPAARERWDEFVTEAGGHVYQSWGWGELKARTGWTPWRVAWEEAGRICAGVSILARPVPGVGKSLLYAPRGPLLAAEQRPRLTDFLEGVCRLDVTRRALLLKLDPPVEAMQDWITPALAVCGFLAPIGTAAAQAITVGATSSTSVLREDTVPRPRRGALAAAPREDATRPPSLGATRHARPGGRVARRGSNVLPSSS